MIPSLLTFKPQTQAQLCDWMQDDTLPAHWCADAAMAPQLETPQWIDLRGLNAITRYTPADMTVTAQAGITVGQLQQQLAEHGQCWPFYAPPNALLADVLATDGPGLESGFYGCVRDWVLGTTVVTGAGVVSQAGGNVVKNVTGYDLNKLIVGSQHTLGLLTEVTLKLQPAAQTRLMLQARFEDLTEAFRFVDMLLRQDDEVALCEVCQTGRLTGKRSRRDDWTVLIELRGQQTLVNSIKPIISEFAVDMTWLEDPKAIDAACQQLVVWPARDTVLEWAFPPAASLLVCRAISTVFGLLDLPVVQARPAAGLLLTGWSAPGDAFMGQVAQVLKQMQHVGLTVQCVQTPHTVYYNRFNAPQDPGVMQLTQRIKQFYDPHYRLSNPRLPL
jgi:hypothetical protein